MYLGDWADSMVAQGSLPGCLASPQVDPQSNWLRGLRHIRSLQAATWQAWPPDVLSLRLQYSLAPQQCPSSCISPAHAILVSPTHQTA